ncbi:MAG TPA: hypothetical protein DCK95_04190 [Anaerolineaceae bacterium]|nr:hypothetical protein [Anaerolineaceae bacterium]
MTKPIYFDTDCWSAFLWVNEEQLVVHLYSDRIIIPEQVYIELSNPRVPHLKNQTDVLINNNTISKQPITLGTRESNLYLKLCTNPDPGQNIIGKGEAAAISLAVYKNGILGSNNLRDVSSYIKLYNLENLTTGDILIDALHQGLISEAKGNGIWINMLKRRRQLPTPTFSDFLKSKSQ